jgi:hypothetical protein
VISNHTVDSLSMDERQTWRAIRKELEDIGITVTAFEANKDFVFEWFTKAVASGAFEERSLNDPSTATLLNDPSTAAPFNDPSTATPFTVSSTAARQGEPDDVKIKEAERSLSYFEDTLHELQARKLQLSQDPSRSGGPVPSQPGLPVNPRGGRPSDVNRGLPPVPQQSQYGGRPPQSPHMSSTQYGDTPGGAIKTYTNLDLIKADTPHTTAKISRMLHQLEFKLQVEMQYKKGIDKMAKLYQADGDKKSRADAESKKVESEKKIHLLQSALKRYKNLHILDDTAEEEEPSGASIIIISSSRILNSVKMDLGPTVNEKIIYDRSLYLESYKSLLKAHESSTMLLSSLQENSDPHLNRLPIPMFPLRWKVLSVLVRTTPAPIDGTKTLKLRLIKRTKSK